VCKAWRDAAAHIAPDRLSFEFDLAAEAGAAGSGAGAVAAAPASKGLLHSLLSAPARLLMHATGHALPAAAVPQAPAAPAQQAEQHAGSSSSSAAATAAERQEADMAALNEPWARWLAARGNRLLEFSMTITNLDSACAAAQCQLKETLLHALAGSAATAVAAATGDTPAGGMKLGDDDSDACGSAGLLKTGLYPGGGSSASSVGSGGSASQPGSPVSTSSNSSEFEACSAASSTSASASASSSSTTSALTSADVISSLQLRSLHLKVPLFEYDVLQLAHDICSNAPGLTELSLVGYSTSGATNTAAATSSSTARPDRGAASSGCHCRSTRRRLFARGSDAAAAAASAAAAAAAASGDAAGAAQLAASSSTTTGSSSRRTGPGRGGFITGSSLKQLVAAAPQLERLTFACRQLYKLSWLAPATQLTYLSLRDCSLGGELLKELAALRLPRLRGLDVSGSRALGGAHVSAHLALLAAIAGGQLMQLDISGWDLSRGGATSSSSGGRALPQLAALAQLRELRMEGCSLRGWEVEPGQLPALSRLSLAGNALDAAGVAAACALSQLRALDVSHVAPRALMLQVQGPHGPGPACWAGMAAMPHLTHLSLAGNAWPDSSLPDYGPVLAYRSFRTALCRALADMRSLASIDLSDAKVPYNTLALLLGSLPSSVSAVVLDGIAGGLRCGDLAALADLPRLRALSARACNVRDKHAAVLADMPALRRLELRDNALSAAGLLQVVEACGQLTLLDVGGNERLSGLHRHCSKCTDCASLQAAIADCSTLLVVRD
jgi:hypothetical protein